MQTTNGDNLSLNLGENPYCTTEDILRLRKLGNQKDGIKHLKEKYESVSKFGPQTDSSVTGVNASPSRGDRDIVRVSGSFESGQKSPTLAGTIGPASFSEGVGEQDILQVDMFFKSHKTDVYVCHCLANLYFGKAVGGKDHWKFTTTGIPLLVLDTGEHHRKRKLQIVLAEKGTGFVLWKNTIDHLTEYDAPHANFHTLHLTTDHTRLAGLSFDDSTAAKEFYSELIKLTSDPNDELFNISKSKKKKKSEKKKAKFKPPKKTEISQPCCFVHVTKLETSSASMTTSVSSPTGFEHTTKNEDDLKQKDRLNDVEVTNLLGSKLTLTSGSTSSGISEDIRQYDQ